MAINTKMITSTNYTIVHGHDALNDAPAHDVKTADATVSGGFMWGNSEFVIESDATVTHNDASAIFNTSASAIGAGGNDCSKYLFNIIYLIILYYVLLSHGT